MIHVSPTGVVFIHLSAPGLAVVATAVSHGEYLFCIISAEEPYLLPERHGSPEVREKCPYAGAYFMMIFHSFSPTNGNTFSMWKETRYFVPDSRDFFTAYFFYRLNNAMSGPPFSFFIFVRYILSIDNVKYSKVA